MEIFYLHIKYKTRILNPENIPDLSGGFIVACNHQSYSDPPVLAGIFKGRFSFMAKSELFKNKLFAWLIKKCGAFPVVRGAKDSAALDRAVEDLKQNKIFVIFPEGTRSKDGVIETAYGGGNRQNNPQRGSSHRGYDRPQADKEGFFPHYGRYSTASAADLQ